MINPEITPAIRELTAKFTLITQIITQPKYYEDYCDWVKLSEEEKSSHPFNSLFAPYLKFAEWQHTDSNLIRFQNQNALKANYCSSCDIPKEKRFFHNNFIAQTDFNESPPETDKKFVAFEVLLMFGWGKDDWGSKGFPDTEADLLEEFDFDLLEAIPFKVSRFMIPTHEKKIFESNGNLIPEAAELFHGKVSAPQPIPKTATQTSKKVEEPEQITPEQQARADRAEARKKKRAAFKNQP